MNTVTAYHKIIRTSALIVAFTLLFQSGVASSTTKQFSFQTEMYLANVVGITASVPENEINQLSAGLEKRKNELDERERNIRQLERNTVSLDDRTTYLLSVTLFILLILIVLNYVMDIVRNRRELKSVST
jgi:hypothetical protein